MDSLVSLSINSKHCRHIPKTSTEFLTYFNLCSSIAIYFYLIPVYNVHAVFFSTMELSTQYPVFRAFYLLGAFFTYSVMLNSCILMLCNLIDRRPNRMYGNVHIETIITHWEKEWQKLRSKAKPINNKKLKTIQNVTQFRALIIFIFLSIWLPVSCSVIQSGFFPYFI